MNTFSTSGASAHTHVHITFDSIRPLIVMISEDKKGGCTVRCQLKEFRYMTDKTGNLTAFLAQDSTSYLPVTPVQLMWPGSGQNTSFTRGDFAWHLGRLGGSLMVHVRVQLCTHHTLNYYASTDVVHWLFIHSKWVADLYQCLCHKGSQSESVA